MKLICKATRLFSALALGMVANLANAADYPAPREDAWIAKDFRFHTGQVLPELKLHYRTLGAPSGEPVLVLHGTNGSGANFLTPEFAGELFGAGQPLDASRYFIILPDALGAGKSAKPSDGLRARFPAYNYDDMVVAQHRLVTEGLGIRHLRLVIGNSMGGMHAWLWGVKYPATIDTLVPMASQPTQMAGRNWIMRRMLTQSIRNDPEWNNGDYLRQPASVKFMSAFYALATSGGNQGLQKLAGSRAEADKLVDARLAAPFATDANDFLYQWEASRDYDATPGLERIQANLLAINSADDERNPPELGIMEREMKRVKNGRLLLLPASPDTRGHGTTGAARYWKAQVQELLQNAKKRAP